MVSEENQRTILQFLLLERMMPYSDFSDTVRRVVGSDNQTDSLIQTLNEKIRRFSQKIVIQNSEISGDKVIVLASTADSAEIVGSLTKDQMDYFYHLMDCMISNQGSTTFIQALNAAPVQTSGRISIGEGEKFLFALIKKKILVLENGLLFLSPLTIVELGSYIMENYALENCVLCKRMVVTGGPCPHCQVMVHSPCARAYAGKKRDIRCPECKGDWTSNEIGM